MSCQKAGLVCKPILLAILVVFIVGAEGGHGTPGLIAGNNSTALVNSTRFTKPYNICTSPWTPFVECTPLGNPANFTGYQIELFRQLAQYQGWKESDYTFTCMDWTPMIQDLVDPYGSCYMAAAVDCKAKKCCTNPGVEVSVENVNLGLQFSWPIYKSGLKILTTGSIKIGQLWSFARAFHWSLWLALGVTGVVGGAVIFFAEWLDNNKNSTAVGLSGWWWYSYAKLVGASDHQPLPRSVGGRIIIWAYCLLVLMMSNIFIAGSASVLTQMRIQSQISSISDLPGKQTITWTNYVNLVTKYNIRPTGMPWDNQIQQDAMVQMLRSGQANALILDAPIVDYIAANDNTCSLFAVGSSFETFSLAMGFSHDFPSELIMPWSTGLVTLQQQEGQLDELEREFITAGSNSCDAYQQDEIQITFLEVAGLWVILAIAVGLGLLLLIVPKVYSYFTGKELTLTKKTDAEHLDQLAGMIANRLSSVITKGSILVKNRRSGTFTRDTDPENGTGIGFMTGSSQKNFKLAAVSGMADQGRGSMQRSLQGQAPATTTETRQARMQQQQQQQQQQRPPLRPLSSARTFDEGALAAAAVAAAAAAGGSSLADSTWELGLLQGSRDASRGGTSAMQLQQRLSSFEQASWGTNAHHNLDKGPASLASAPHHAPLPYGQQQLEAPGLRRSSNDLSDIHWWEYTMQHGKQPLQHQHQPTATAQLLQQSVTQPPIKRASSSNMGFMNQLKASGPPTAGEQHSPITLPTDVTMTVTRNVDGAQAAALQKSTSARFRQLAPPPLQLPVTAPQPPLVQLQPKQQQQQQQQLDQHRKQQPSIRPAGASHASLSSLDPEPSSPSDIANDSAQHAQHHPGPERHFHNALRAFVQRTQHTNPLFQGHPVQR